MPLHDYVVHGEGDPREALGALDSWVWQVQSVLAMIEWLRDFNADRPLADRVRVYGFGGHSTYSAVSRLEEQFSAVDTDVLDDVAADLALVDDDGGLSKEHVDVQE